MLVGEDQQERITQLILVQHALELFTCLDNTISVVGIDHEDDTLGVLEVMPPQRSNLVLTTNIPHCELNVLVFDRFNVEACHRCQFEFKAHTEVRRLPIVGMVVLGMVSKALQRFIRLINIHNFTELELVQNGGLSGRVKTNHQNSHLLLPP